MNINDYIFVLYSKSPQNKYFQFSLYSEGELEDCGKSIATYLKKYVGRNSGIFYDINNNVMFRLDEFGATITLSYNDKIIDRILKLVNSIQRNYGSTN